jgi:hypothetical protein
VREKVAGEAGRMRAQRGRPHPTIADAMVTLSRERGLIVSIRGFALF